MKIKTVFSISITLILSGVLISCGNKASSDPTEAELKGAIGTLKTFGDIIAKGNVSENNKKIIALLARDGIEIPIPKLFRKKAVLIGGFDPDRKSFTVLNTVTGKKIRACGKKCKTKVIPPNDDVQTALNINKPIPGKIMKDGKEINAWYIVTVKALYKGSKCETYYSGGSKYEDCYVFPFPSF